MARTTAQRYVSEYMRRHGRGRPFSANKNLMKDAWASWRSKSGRSRTNPEGNPDFLSADNKKWLTWGAIATGAYFLLRGRLGESTGRGSPESCVGPTCVIGGVQATFR